MYIYNIVSYNQQSDICVCVLKMGDLATKMAIVSIVLGCLPQFPGAVVESNAGCGRHLFPVGRQGNRWLGPT